MKVDQNIVAFITGSSSGFGWQVANDLLAIGARCYLTDLQDRSIELVQKYGSTHCIFRKLDITDEQGVKEAIEDCAVQFGYISVVVNSAGIAQKSMSILDPKSDSNYLRFMLKVNVIGTFNVTKFAALQFVKQVKKDGIEAKKDYLIINFGSVASTNGMYGMVHYSAAKGAVLAMTLPVARDIGKFGVRIVCVLPGFFNTPMGRSIPDKLYNLTARTTALGRHGETSELSDAVKGLMESTFVTGTFFHMDSSFASPHL